MKKKRILFSVITIALVVLLGIGGFMIWNSNSPIVSEETLASNNTSREAPPKKANITEPEKIYKMHGQLPEMSLNRMVERSSLIVYGEIIDHSDSFVVKSGYGDRRAYTDYYLKPHEILRGESKGDEITIRLEGGYLDGHFMESVNEAKLEVGKEYLLLLEKPRKISQTESDFYFVTNKSQGAFEVENNLFNIEDSVIVSDWSMAEFKNQLTFLSKKYPVVENLAEQETDENMKENLESGWITQKEYDEYLENKNNSAVIEP